MWLAFVVLMAALLLTLLLVARVDAAALRVEVIRAQETQLDLIVRASGEGRARIEANGITPFATGSAGSTVRRVKLPAVVHLIVRGTRLVDAGEVFASGLHSWPIRYVADPIVGAAVQLMQGDRELASRNVRGDREDR